MGLPATKPRRKQRADATGAAREQLRSGLAGPFELNLGSGACAAITGPSGSGKSLFPRMVADLDPNEGVIWLNGRAGASIDCNSPAGPERTSVP